jgi:hypothetical protein
MLPYCFVIIVTENWLTTVGIYSKGALEHFSCQMYLRTLVMLLGSALSDAVETRPSCCLTVSVN